MKSKILYVLLFAAASTLTSCTGDWIDTTKEGTPTETSFWKTDNDYIKACNSLYYIFGLEETYGRDLYWEQGANDDIFYSRSRGSGEMALANMTYDGSTESRLETIFDEFYTTIAIANNIVYHALQIPEAERTDVQKRSLGEAYFMRAFSHLMIAYRYGRADNGVPFSRYEEMDNVSVEMNEAPTQQATVMDNYKMIIEDLQKAYDNLDWFKNYSTDDYGRPTKDAALAYMVKTYAYWAQHDKSQWANIPALVDSIEIEGERALLDNYADVFKIDNNWSKEYIFSVNSSSANFAGSEFPGIVLENKGWGIYNGWGNFKPTLELYAEYNDQDERRDATILKYGDTFEFFGSERSYYSASDNECGFQFNKYMDGFADGQHASSNGDRPTTDLNVPLTRFAEMLLFKAEALIMQGKNAEAAEPLNRIATRAGEGVTYTAPTMMDLMHERRCELAGEWTDRRFDLIRWANSGTDDWNDDALNKLNASKHGLKHVDRADPNSALDTENGYTMVINGKTYEGVMDLANFSTPKNFERNGYNSVFPYRINTVIQSNGKLKQNEGYASE
jgi:hypothetical protein